MPYPQKYPHRTYNTYIASTKLLTILTMLLQFFLSIEDFGTSGELYNIIFLTNDERFDSTIGVCFQLLFP